MRPPVRRTYPASTVARPCSTCGATIGKGAVYCRATYWNQISHVPYSLAVCTPCTEVEYLVRRHCHVPEAEPVKVSEWAAWAAAGATSAEPHERAAALAYLERSAER